MPQLHFDPKTVRSISPQTVDVSMGVAHENKCGPHNGSATAWLVFSAFGYTWDGEDKPIADTIILKAGDVALINGTMLDNFREAIEKAKPGEVIGMPGMACGCTFRKLSDSDLAAMLPEGKLFHCKYASVHFIDER